MDRKKLRTALLVGMMAITTVIGSIATAPHFTQNVYAATNNAIGQDVNVSYNGKTVELGAYNIDGYNYFRIADIGSLLNFATTQEQVYLGTEYYIKMITKTPYGSAITPISTENTKASVDLDTMKLQFDEYTGSIQRFNLNDRNYFKLGDIVAISKENYNRTISAITDNAQKGIGTKLGEGKTTTKLDTSYDGASKTITIIKTVTDLQQVYEDEYYKTFGADKFKQTFGKDYNASSNANTKNNIPNTIQEPSLLTTPPEVGSFPAKILKDPSKGAYLSNGNVNWDNYEQAYRGGSAGQCTWYAMGRFEEVTGVVFDVIPYNFEKVEAKDKFKVIRDAKAIIAPSIAVFGEQHVVFVEYVEKDKNGNPTFVYFTEANGDSNDKYDVTIDGYMDKQSYDSFLKRSGSKVPYRGCIIMK